ncbi:PTS sugar transporter subunit IIB [soil metagenome]|nr:PTS sugar transporter subunit IIB [Gemmatimonadota bacterium]
MPIVLYRVDERLIHGQVVVGWGGPLNADRVMVVDDEIADSPWEQELYCLGVPPEIEASFSSVADARRALDGWRGSPRRLIILVRNVETLQRLADDERLQGERVNLGGLHHTEGRRRVLPYLFLSDTDRIALAAVAAQGVEISAQDLPGSRSVPLDQLLNDS